MRALRGLVVTLVVLAGVLVIVDIAARLVAQHQVASRLQASQHLTSTPTVHIRGLSFLYQAARGRYDEIDLGARDVPAKEVRVDRVQMALKGVQVDPAKALSGDLEKVPVDSATGTATVTYAELNAAAPLQSKDVTVGERNGLLAATISTTVPVLGQVKAEADSTVTVSGSRVVLSPQQVRLPGGVLNGAVSAVLRNRLKVTVDASGLPFGIALQSVRVTPDGLVAEGVSQGFVLPTQGSGTG